MGHGIAGWPNSALASCWVTSLHASTVAAGGEELGGVALEGEEPDPDPPAPGARGVDAPDEVVGGLPAL